MPTNRLSHCTSPYLLQHAHNPVDWYPWGPEALGRAQAEARPILLSVGYSACHWCHVMERESFEDPATAAIMNEHFVNIKVDREERPDIDELYMRAVQAFTGGHGGWPMTVFLTPEGQPFFGGTYFPPTPQQGMPSFQQVLQHVIQSWKGSREEIAEVTAQLSQQLRAGGRLPRPADVEGDWLSAVAEALGEDFDPDHGGFGERPKFPAPHAIRLLLLHHHLTGDVLSRHMAEHSLAGMAKGGVYDLLGGGFCRYSVDEAWRVPHFEKMLYDNAQLVPAYIEAWQLTGREDFRRVAVESLDYVLREMTLPDGGFCAAQDADSEGVEGRYFVWTPAELRSELGFLDGLKAALLLGVTDEGTFEHGTSVLRLEEPMEQMEAADRELVQRALEALRQRRASRVAPATDDKVILSWNALMISAFAQAGAALGDQRYVGAAARAARFLLSELREEGRLMRTWRAGRAHTPAFSEDHAAMVGALVDLYEADFDPAWLREALSLAEAMIFLFWDDEQGGFHFSGRDAEALIAPSKHMIGGAEPSAHGMAALAFARLARLCDRADLGERADRVLMAYQPLLSRAPRALALEARAWAWRQLSGQELFLAGSAGMAELLGASRKGYHPLLVRAAAHPELDLRLMPWIEGKQSEGPATAWLCEGGTCKAPTRSAEELAAQLRPEGPQVDPGASAARAPALPTDPAAWINSAPLSLEALKGQVVLLDFWTYCCINCQHILPELAAVEQRYEGAPVVVIGVHSAKFPREKEREAVVAAVERHGLRHPVVHDPDHQLWQAFGVSSWPTLMLLDTEGRVRWRQAGEVDRQGLAVQIDRLLMEAQARDTLAEEAIALPGPRAQEGLLAFPGKVQHWPGAGGQEQGRDPYGREARLYVADTGHHRVLELKISLARDGWPRASLQRAWGGGGPGLVDGGAAEARFDSPQGMDRSGKRLFVADTGNHCLRRIDLDTGEVQRVAGTGLLGRGAPRAAPPTQLSLRSPWDVAIAGPDNGGGSAAQEAVFIAMAGAHQLWVYLPHHDRIAPLVGNGREDHVDGAPTEASLAQPSGLEIWGRYMFFADAETSSVRVFDLAERTVGTMVGRGLFDFGDIDGDPEQVRLQHPLDLCAAEGVIYVADTYNHKIKGLRMAGGQTATLAGGPGELLEPGGLTVVGQFLVVADTGHHRLVAIDRRTGALRPLPIDG